MNTILTEELSRFKLDAKYEYVFSSDNGNPPVSTRKAWEKALRKAEIAYIVTVKELLRHKTIAMTIGYAHLSQEHKKKVVEFLDRQY